MRLAPSLRALLGCSFCFLTGCSSLLWPSRSEFTEMQNVLRVLRAKMDDHDTRIFRLATHLTYCSDEVTALVTKVTEDCNGAPDSVCRLDENSVAVQLTELDPTGQGRFLALMQDNRHVVFYGLNGKGELSATDRKSLRDLVKPAWLDDGKRRTRFVVAAHPEDQRPGSIARAKQRALQVVQAVHAITQEAPELIGLSLPKSTLSSEMQTTTSTIPSPSPLTSEPTSGDSSSAPVSSVEQAQPYLKLIHDGRVLPWVFKFSVRGETLRPDDRPKEPNALSRSVWVFRVDC